MPRDSATALGVPIPAGLPEALLGPDAEALGNLASRYARTHAPFTLESFAARFGVARVTAERTLRRLVAAGRLLEGEFRPGGIHHEWCDAGVLGVIRRRSLAKLRREVEPVDPHVLGRFVTAWHGIVQPRQGLDALLDAIEHLQGAPIAASRLEREILPARVAGYRAEHLDTLVAAGEVVWVGVGPLGDRDGRMAVYLSDHAPHLIEAIVEPSDLPARERALLDELRRGGASFFGPLHEATGGGYPQDSVDALWNLVWRGLVTNDSLHALRAFVQPAGRARRAVSTGRPFRSRRTSPPSGQGRWTLAPHAPAGRTPTEHRTALAHQLLTRHGVVTREVAAAEGVPGGFTGLYEIYKRMEERGRLRRGYFTLGVGATQFALPAALESLRSLRADPDEVEVVQLAATDPGNPYGSILKWPGPDTPMAGAGRGPTRTVGASVVLVNGRLAAFVARGGRSLTSYLPESEPDRSTAGRAVAARLAGWRDEDRRDGALLISEINGAPASGHALGAWLVEAGFVATALGFQLLRQRAGRPAREQVTRGAESNTDAESNTATVTQDGAEDVSEPTPRRQRSLVSSPFAALRRR